MGRDGVGWGGEGAGWGEAVGASGEAVAHRGSGQSLRLQLSYGRSQVDRLRWVVRQVTPAVRIGEAREAWGQWVLHSHHRMHTHAAELRCAQLLGELLTSNSLLPSFATHGEALLHGESLGALATAQAGTLVGRTTRVGRHL